jgi:hypothetical protein
LENAPLATRFDAGDRDDLARSDTPQPTPGYREATADSATHLVCQRCGALISDTAITYMTASM